MLHTESEGAEVELKLEENMEDFAAHKTHRMTFRQVHTTANSLIAVIHYTEEKVNDRWAPRCLAS